MSDHALLPDPREIEVFAAARAEVLERIAAAASRAGRAPGDVTLVAVSKTVPAERLVSAVAAGLTLLGENRIQEGAGKAPLLPGATWHLVGPLQSNKARVAARTFAMIESVDSLDLARRLDRIAGELAAEGAVGPAEVAAAGGRLPILLQVNVDADQQKAGFDPASLPAAIDEIAALPNLDLRGLMTIGRLVGTAEEARPTFIALRELAARLRSEGHPLGPELSMGMSGDYEVAVEEGSTIVRVGRALFGERAPRA